MNHSFDQNSLNRVLYEIINLSSKKFDTLHEKLLASLVQAKNVSGFENGFIGQIEGDQYNILQSDTVSGVLVPNMIFDFGKMLYQELVQKRTTVINGQLQADPAPLFENPVLSDTQAVVGAPIFNEDSVIGALLLCSDIEKTDAALLDFHAHILELIAGQLSHLLRERGILEKLEEDRLLLHMGAELLQMGTYKRCLRTGIVECTDSIYAILDLAPSETVSFDTILPRVVAADKRVVIQNFKRYNPQSIASIEYRLMTRAGTIKWIRHQTNYNAIKKYVLGIVQDITVLKTSLLELDRRNKELEQFAYATAHDLQEPLRTIRGFSELLINSHKEQIDEEGQLYLSFLKDSSERMQQQIEGLLHHSRIGRTGQRITIDLDELVRTTIDDFSFSIIQQEAKVVLLKNLPSIVGYATEIRMLFQNLISNALKFSDPDRKSLVEISYADQGTHYAFQVADNGIGMEASRLDKIFELFVRLNSREAYAGTGIGLTHCKKIVELHNGTIHVSSTPHVGSF